MLTVFGVKVGLNGILLIYGSAQITATRLACGNRQLLNMHQNPSEYKVSE